MIKNFLLKKTAIPILTKGLDVYALRQKTNAANISNVQNPNYRRKEVKFEEQLQNALQNNMPMRPDNEGHFQITPNSVEEVVPVVVEDYSQELSSGVNNVDIDQEMVEQVKNEIRFLYGSRMISKQFAALRASIKGRYDQ